MPTTMSIGEEDYSKPGDDGKPSLQRENVTIINSESNEERIEDMQEGDFITISIHTHTTPIVKECLIVSPDELLLETENRDESFELEYDDEEEVYIIKR